MPKKTKSFTKKKGNKPKQSFSAVQLVAMADEAMQALDVQTALINYQKAVPMLENQNETELPAVLAKLAECKVSMGDQDGARDDFERAIQLSPQGPVRACLYHYLGQLSSDDEALEAHQKGIQELEQCIALGQYSHERVEDPNENNASDDGEITTLSDLQQHLVRAHCAVAELYLTDLCFEDDAEQCCESHVQKALKLSDPPLVDALQAAASLRLSQKQDAMPFILQAYQAMKNGCEALALLVGLEEEDLLEENGDARAVELTQVDAVNQLPGFEFRCQTAKLLLECGALTLDENSIICVKAAIQVLGSLLAENDEIVEIWFLLGCAFDLMQSQSLAQHYWQHALDMLLKVQEQLKQDADTDDDALQPLTECESHIADIMKRLEQIEQQKDANDLDEDVEMKEIPK